MPGRRINRAKVAKYMEHRKGLDQAVATAASMFVNSSVQHSPSCW